MYNLVEIFESLQGEGRNMGRPCVFVRFAGCNLKCPWCDTDVQKRFSASLEEVLKELEQKDYENVLIVCHGGIIRALKGYLEDRPNGIKWRPKPKNCEVVIYEALNGKHHLLETMRP